MSIKDRQHEIFKARVAQIARNMLAHKGGRPYVDARLWRAPNESDLSWAGSGSEAGAVGRKDRAAYVNDAGRVVSKITQYLFKRPADRDGLDEQWARDVDGRGTPLESWWMDANEALTAGQWMWAQVDRAAPLVGDDGSPRGRTLLEKARDRDFVRWSLWPSVCVPDWSFDDAGRLRWIITEAEVYDNADPQKDAASYALRTLWRKVDGGVEITGYRTDGHGGDERPASGPVTYKLDRLPFVLIGAPSSDPWWFDDVELLQAQSMNLDSLHIENLVRSVFPQLIIPETMLTGLEVKLIERLGASNGERVTEAVREIVRGLDSPIVESADENGITRFIQPSAADLKAIPEETERKRRLLFDMTGLALFNKETRQIQTAASKQFDQLDTESTLKHRAAVMQDAEERLVEMSKAVDPLFREYKAVWPQSFDVADVAGDSAAVAMISNMPDLTPAMRKLAMRAALRIIGELGGHDKTLISQAVAEIDEADFGVPDDEDGV